MITVTEKEIERWRSAPETEMKWDEYPWDVGEKRCPVKVAFGAGLNSTAMLVGCVYQGRPVDKILFADTGGERPGTYRHKEEVSQWLGERGYPEVEDVYFTNGDGERVTLFERCLDQGMLPSLAYGFMKKACSMKFKQTPQKQHMRQWEPAQRAWEQGALVLDLVGFDVGESHRYADDKGKSEKYRVRYPLAEDWKWTRKDCRRVIAYAGLQPPEKSSCFFCPSMNIGEIKKLKREQPDLYEKALRMERNAQPNLQDGSSIEGLGGPLSWNALDEKLETQGELDLPTQETPRKQECMCYDGDRPDRGDPSKEEAPDPAEKSLPFAMERAGKLDAAYNALQTEKARQSEEEDGTAVDVPAEQLDIL